MCDDDKFGGLEVHTLGDDDRFGGLQVRTLCVMMISFEVCRFTRCVMMMISLEVWRFTRCV